MKKLKTLLCTCLCGFTLFPLVACKNTGVVETEQKTGTLSQILLNDFETVEDFDCIHIGNRLGKVTQNKESAYVKNGTGSALLSVQGNFRYASPYLYQPFDLENADDYRDFSKCVRFSCWAYNDSDEEKKVELQLDFSQGEMGTESFALKPKAWTHVVYNVQRENLPIERCEGIYLYFEKNLDAFNKIYLDDLTLYRTDEGYTKNPITLDEHEICSFDKFYQHGLLTSASDSSEARYLPRMSITQDYAKKDKDFNVKCLAPAGSLDVDNGSQNWPGIEIHSSLIDAVNWELYDNADVFSFDVYVPKENGLNRIWLSFYNSQEIRYFVSDAIMLETGKWQTVSFSVKELNSQTENAHLYGFSDTARVVIRWGEFVGADRTIYFDNFRMNLNY